MSGSSSVPVKWQCFVTRTASLGKPKSDVEWMIYRASQTPGPGQYDPVEKKNATGKFSTSKPKSDVEWKIYNASKIPGPGQCVPRPCVCVCMCVYFCVICICICV